MRIGIGNDLHKLVEKRPLMMGGVEIPSTFGEEAHSDGDVLLHALIDAILGSQALGDIGELFPPEDMSYKNMDSKILLKEVLKRTSVKIQNLDSIIELERPKLGPWKAQIRESLTALLNLELNQVSVKAKTNEGLGPVGKGEAVKATVMILTE